MNIKINESEKKRILEMHNSKNPNKFLFEQDAPAPAAAPAPAPAAAPQGLDTKTGGAGGRLRGGLSRLRTGLGNLGAATRGDAGALKSPELEAVLTRVKANTTQMQKQLSDTYNALNQLKSSINAGKIPQNMQDEMAALQGQIDTYIQSIGSMITQTDNFNKFQIPYK